VQTEYGGRPGGGTENALTRFYREMLRIRLLEERIVALYPEQEMRCPVHLCIGQEAVAVGVCAALDRRDYVLSGHRSHGHYLAKGGDLNAMMAEIYGKATGCAGGKGGSMHLIDLEAGFLGSTPIVGSTIPIAVGAAFGSVLRDDGRVATVFFGDGAVETGVFYESLNFAALKKLPVIFVCENNLYSVYSPLEVRQPAGRRIIDLGTAHGIESVQGDGNNVELVYQLCSSAVEKARSGGGPTLFEFATYRWREHCGPEYDDHLGYRSEKEYLTWKKHCPVAQLESRLLGSVGVSRSALDDMTKEIATEIEAAVAFARQSPFPEKHLMLASVVAE
jgi:TPP-dependent pyruvate/acetoin dehydrogenase alpha subunit